MQTPGEPVARGPSGRGPPPPFGTDPGGTGYGDGIIHECNELKGYIDMNATLIGLAALGVAVLGLMGHAWAIVRRRTASFAMLWVMVPLTGSAIAFLLAPVNLMTISLAGAALLLAALAVLTPLVVPVLLTEGETDGVESK